MAHFCDCASRHTFSGPEAAFVNRKSALLTAYKQQEQTISKLRGQLREARGSTRKREQAQLDRPKSTNTPKPSSTANAGTTLTTVKPRKQRPVRYRPTSAPPTTTVFHPPQRRIFPSPPARPRSVMERPLLSYDTSTHTPSYNLARHNRHRSHDDSAPHDDALTFDPVVRNLPPREHYFLVRR